MSLAPPIPASSTDRETARPFAWHRLRRIAGLTLVAGAACLGVLLLVGERQDRQREVEAEIARAWGPPQQVQGPVMVLPFTDDSGQPRHVLAAARSASFDVTLDTAERRRGPFAATVYDARVKLAGRFEVPDEGQLIDLLGAAGARIHWDRALIGLAVGRLGSVNPGDGITIDGRKETWGTCSTFALRGAACPGERWVLAPLKTAGRPEGAVAYTGEIGLRGTGEISFVPSAPQAELTLASPWPNPSFFGDVLPATYTITKAGFTANWRIDEIGAPRAVTGTLPGMIPEATARLAGSGSFGVALVEGMPVYRMITRVAKYGLLPVVLAFALLLAFEATTRLRIHIVQYALVGIAMTLFPLMLLSFSEWLGYNAAFGLSAGLVVAQTSLYTAAVSREVTVTTVFGGLMSALFGFLFVLLGLEVYALLVGTVAVFLALSAAMVLSLRFDPAGSRAVPAQA